VSVPLVLLTVSTTLDADDFTHANKTKCKSLQTVFVEQSFEEQCIASADKSVK